MHILTYPCISMRTALVLSTKRDARLTNGFFRNGGSSSPSYHAGPVQVGRVTRPTTP